MPKFFIDREEIMSDKKVLLKRPNKEIYVEGDVLVKKFDKSFKKSDILNEAINQTRVAEAEKRASVSFAEEGALPYLGGSLPVVVREGARTRVTKAPDGTLTVIAPSREAADRALSRLLIAKAKKVLPAMFAEAQAETNGMFGAPVIPTVRVMRSRWGSCDRTKRAIKLNALLVTAPPECVRYVCLHELAHLKVHGHGADFHALLEKLCPGHRALKRRLDALALRRLP